MKLLSRFAGVLLIALLCSLAQPAADQRIDLPTSKFLETPSPGRIGTVNSFPATIALSPNAHYAALLNDGFGMQEVQGHQTIAVLNLETNQIADFPDERLGQDARQRRRAAT